MRQIKAERQSFILELLHQEKKIIASELSARLNVSEDTIRRDLNELDEKGLLKRVHSGAVGLGPAIVDFGTREDVNLEEKIRLAKQGASYIKTDSVVIIDGGTTNYQVVKQIPKDRRCTIVTNSTPIIILLKDYPNIEVVVLGGFLHKQSLVTVGYDLIKQLDSIHADVYFMGVSHVDNEVGISIATLEECQTKQKMMQISSKIVAMVTKEKIGSLSNYVVGKLSDITYLITDDAFTAL